MQQSPQMSTTKTQQPAEYPVAIAVDDSQAYYVPAPPTTVAAHQASYLPTLARATPPPAPKSSRHFIRTGVYNVAVTIALIVLTAISGAYEIGLFVILITGLSVGLGTLPLACVGIALLVLFWALLGQLAKLDEFLFLKRKILFNAITKNLPARLGGPDHVA
ncbi:Aste57867_9344 [Aphanomyces stellatus]|uniref:Aste57867_9344 protein n=1 Tax=Aphanomyces stellatus TaxID=120398 RepID=A0A485KMK0_9STRA|nr:hypothetical protein As57867_009308 [Aphanomyces stellatus]VFT86225.1 Aste57867_9344 [Aphanomyces stellatus]